MTKSIKLTLTKGAHEHFSQSHISLDKRETDFDEFKQSVAMNVGTKEQLQQFLKDFYYPQVNNELASVLLDDVPFGIAMEIINETKRISPDTDVKVKVHA